MIAINVLENVVEKWGERGDAYLEVIIKVLQVSLVWRDLVTACLLFLCL